MPSCPPKVTELTQGRGMKSVGRRPAHAEIAQARTQLPRSTRRKREGHDVSRVEDPRPRGICDPVRYRARLPRSGPRTHTQWNSEARGDFTLLRIEVLEQFVRRFHGLSLARPSDTFRNGRFPGSPTSSIPVPAVREQEPRKREAARRRT